MNRHQHPPGRQHQMAHARTHAHAALRLQSLFESGFPYSKKLSAHRSCVNAIVFSRGEGRWLAGAGDDLRVLLWDMHQEDVGSPSSEFAGHTSNIFCLDFSARNQFIYSGSTDERILKYDISTGTGAPPCQSFLTHNASVRGLSCHPENDDVFLSAGEDGLVALHDTRTQGSSTRLSGTLENPCELTDVRFHPLSDKLFFTTDIRGNVCLRDARMAFDAGGRVIPGAGVGTVLKYVTSITRRSVSYVVQPEAASLAIDRDGKKFAVTFLNHLPTIYSTSDPYPLAVCSGQNLPSGEPVPECERTYRNACTIKHGNFGGPGLGDDPYFTSGSDDFRGYVWKVPDLAELTERRRVVSTNDFMNSEPSRTIGYASKMSDSDRYIPVNLSTPTVRLQGHKSIVNSSIIHPHLPLIATCGVERYVTMHSPTADAPNMRFTQTSETVRALPEDNQEATRRFIRALLDGHGLTELGGDEQEEEQKTLDFFDGVIRESGDANAFTAGPTAGGEPA
ncbi:hypothetical protein M0805_003356 [Coniferiporia weirii]|nr:hypothetical protein M0805_003356 [Coniferiporia weirii]